MIAEKENSKSCIALEKKPEKWYHFAAERLQDFTGLQCEPSSSLWRWSGKPKCFENVVLTVTTADKTMNPANQSAACVLVIIAGLSVHSFIDAGIEMVFHDSDGGNVK